MPDSWLEAGKTITLKKAPTHFGVLNLHAESTVQQGDSGWDGVLTLKQSLRCGAS